MPEKPEKADKPLPDLSEVFDLKRDKVVRGFVEEFEVAFRERDAANDRVRELAAEAKAKQFSPMDIAAMKDIAKLKKDDTRIVAAAKLAALKRVSNATKMDLFTWADEQTG